MNVISTTGVMTRIVGGELNYSIRACWLQTSMIGLVDVGQIINVTISTGNNAAVYTSAVAVPEVDIDIWDWLASGCVNHLDVEDEFHPGTVLIVSHI